MQMGVIATATGQQVGRRSLAFLFAVLRQSQLPRGDITPHVEVPNLAFHVLFFLRRLLVRGPGHILMQMMTTLLSPWKFLGDCTSMGFAVVLQAAEQRDRPSSA